MSEPGRRRVAFVVALLAGIGLLVVGVSLGPSDEAGPTGARAPRSRTTSGPRSPTGRGITTTTTATGVPPPVATIPPTIPTVPPVPAGPAPPETAAGAAGGELNSSTLPLPEGIGVESDPGSCTWDAADGGTLRASGTVTNLTDENDVWIVTVSWLDGAAYFDGESDFYEIAAGGTVPWSLLVPGSDPPGAALSCQIEVL